MFHEVWFAQGVCNIGAFLSVFKQRLNDTFMQNWHNRLKNYSGASFIRMYLNFSFTRIWKILMRLNICMLFISYECLHTG